MGTFRILSQIYKAHTYVLFVRYMLNSIIESDSVLADRQY